MNPASRTPDISTSSSSEAVWRAINSTNPDTARSTVPSVLVPEAA